jgi:hypothetical protein
MTISDSHTEDGIVWTILSLFFLHFSEIPFFAPQKSLPCINNCLTVFVIGTSNYSFQMLFGLQDIK